MIKHSILSTSSELILNPDGSIYHLGIKPEHISPTILTVGDPNRVFLVSQFFDKIIYKHTNREFVYHLGTYKNQKIAVISTGIGTDNIDIVMNELDALVNINFKTKKRKEKKTALKIIRIGTSGSIQKSIPVDSILVSTAAVSLERLLDWYFFKTNVKYDALQVELEKIIGFKPHISSAGSFWNSQIPMTWLRGITLTANGFYAPQFRSISLKSKFSDFIPQLCSNNRLSKITNIEMETAGIYGLSELFGHHAISINAILANRTTNTFSTNPESTIQKMIEQVFEYLF